MKASCKHRITVPSSFSALPLPPSHMIHSFTVNIQVYGEEDEGTLKGGHVWASGRQLHEVLLQKLVVILQVGVVHLKIII